MNYEADVYFERRDGAIGRYMRKVEAACDEEAIAKARSIEGTIWAIAEIWGLKQVTTTSKAVDPSTTEVVTTTRIVDLSKFPKEMLKGGTERSWSRGISTKEIDFCDEPAIWNNLVPEFWIEVQGVDGEKKGPIGRIYLRRDGLWTFNLKDAQFKNKELAEAILEQWKFGQKEKR